MPNQLNCIQKPNLTSSYKNLLFQVSAFTEIIHCSTKEEFISVLPLSHMLEITAGLIAPLYRGACVTYCDTLKTTTLLPLMKKIGTTAMICVPLVLKMINGGIKKKVEKLSYSKQQLFKKCLVISKFLLKFNNLFIKNYKKL